MEISVIELKATEDGYPLYRSVGFTEDDSKYLEAIKAGMRTQALDEVDTKSYVELLISAAEECAYEVSNAIHTNFIVLERNVPM